MDIKPIRTDSDYREALADIEKLMTAKSGTPEGDKPDVLVTLVEAYEAKHYPMELPDRVEANKFEMEQKGLTVKDLEPLIGRRNRGYEILNRKRPLTLAMIRKLNQSLGIPADSLIKPTELSAWSGCSNFGLFLRPFDCSRSKLGWPELVSQIKIINPVGYVWS